MEIKELKDKHYIIAQEYTEEIQCSIQADQATKLSVEFAINILKDVQMENELSFLDFDIDHYLNLKIQELQNYLDEK